MMRRIAVLVLIFSVLLGSTVHAAGTDSVTITTPVYIHKNSPGTYQTNVIYGDARENDATIRNFQIEASGIQSTDKLYVSLGSGNNIPIQNGANDVNSYKSQTMKIVLEKSGYNESLIVIRTIQTDDASNGGTIVTYFYPMPAAHYGDLGPGTNPGTDPGTGGGTDPGDGGALIRVNSTFYYVPYEDIYRVDYTAPANIARYQLSFEAASGIIYTQDYDFSPTGTHYLTCNGKYTIYFYGADGKLAAESQEMITNKILDPVCKSYTDPATAKNELNARPDNGNIVWDTPPPDTTKVEIWKDGQKVDEKDPAETKYGPAQPGSYSVVAVGPDGKPVGQSDLKVTDGYDGTDPGGGTTPTDPNAPCDDICKRLEALLECPAWDDYLGDMTGAIRDALPPPPDWDSIADKIGKATVRHLADYIGEVPDPPSQQEIDNSLPIKLPQPDKSVSEAEQLKPQVPDDYNSGPIDFDLDSTPAIPTPDESKPFDLPDPVESIKHDAPGVPVLPEDPRNSSEGIKNPEKVETGEAPKPGKIIFELPREPGPTPKQPDPSPSPVPSVPPAEIPIPSSTGSGPAIPAATDGVIPIPSS